MMKLHTPRDTGRAIVLKDNQILLMERWRDGLHYFSIPGGGIEYGEDAEAAAIREVKEETSIDIAVDRLLYKMTDGGRTHNVFLGHYLGGEPKLPPDSEEAKAGVDNLYKPRWIPVGELRSLHLGFWRPLHDKLVSDIENGFSKSVKITAA